ncbi:MAG: AzlC family ABC transporter permease [Vibrio sp.]
MSTVSPTEQPSSSHTRLRLQQIWQGTLAISPLSIAVIPWGLLAGSYAMEAGLSGLESQALSAILFAGSAQLVATGMLKSGVGLVTMLLTTLFITSRHCLYSIAMRDTIKTLPLRWRLILGFLLTDELFAISGQRPAQPNDRWFLLGAGLSFYLVWNGATVIGILAGHYIPNLNTLGLDFAVAATFIAIVVPNTKSLPVLTAVSVSLVCSIVFEVQELSGGLMFASAAGMITGYLCEISMTRGKQ